MTSIADSAQLNNIGFYRFVVSASWLLLVLPQFCYSASQHALVQHTGFKASLQLVFSFGRAFLLQASVTNCELGSQLGYVRDTR